MTQGNKEKEAEKLELGFLGQSMRAHIELCMRRHTLKNPNPET